MYMEIRKMKLHRHWSRRQDLITLISIYFTIVLHYIQKPYVLPQSRSDPGAAGCI